MSRPDQAKLSTNGGADLGQNPFSAALGGLSGLSNGPVSGAGTHSGTARHSGKDVPPEKNRGRVDVLRTTAGRGGKTVTVAKNFVGIGLPEKEALCKVMRGAAGCGGTVKDGAIEIQGDQREVVARVLREAGFRPVMAGG
jgi:translation initiation factor 1